MDQSLNVIFTYIIENAIPVYDAQRVMLITQTMHNDLNSRYPPKFIEPSQLTAETNAKSKLRFTISYFSTHRLVISIELSSTLVRQFVPHLTSVYSKTLFHAKM